MQHILAIFINNFINIIVNLYLQITKKDDKNKRYGNKIFPPTHVDLNHPSSSTYETEAPYNFFKHNLV